MTADWVGYLVCFGGLAFIMTCIIIIAFDKERPRD